MEKYIHIRTITIVFLSLLLMGTSCSKGDDADSDNPNSSTTSCASLQNQYDTQTQYLSKDINRYNTLQTTNAALKQSILKGIRTTQKLMRTIRQTATGNGCSISKSKLEDW